MEGWSATCFWRKWWVKQIQICVRPMPQGLLEFTLYSIYNQALIVLKPVNSRFKYLRFWTILCTSKESMSVWLRGYRGTYWCCVMLTTNTFHTFLQWHCYINSTAVSSLLTTPPSYHEWACIRNRITYSNVFYFSTILPIN